MGSIKTSQADPVALSSQWCGNMEAALAKQSINDIVGLFNGNGWWRDILNIDSSDFNSLQTSDIAAHLVKFGIPAITNLKVIRPHDAIYMTVSPEVTWVQSFLTYETVEGRGKGFLRLTETSPGSGEWKAYTFFTTLWEIKGHEEFAYDRRPIGANHGENVGRKNWLDLRKEAVKFDTSDPQVLIIGGGQNGLMLAARLTVLGIPNLIIERNPRLGDSWRNRYHTLCLHDPIWADHFPYIPYPPSWPIYTPKDKLANWFESYADAMELNVWLSSTTQADPVFNEKTKKWTIVVEKNGAAPRTMQVDHLVLATGFSGEAKMPKFDQSEFEGTITHSSKHPGANGWAGSNVVVIGACNSGHDISADAYEQGANVTIVQRSSTYVMSSEFGVPGLLDGYYQEGGPPTDDADLMLTSLPVNLLNEYHIAATKAIAVKDKPLLDGLVKAGFKLNHYPGGLFIKYFRDGGGYYIDVGCSGLIIDGKIKIKQGVEVEKLTKNGVLFADGTLVPADHVVCATGYSSQRETVARVISSDVAKRLGPVWGEDKQGEIPSVWRNNGVPHFWLQCGNFFQARCFSKHVALQIQMIQLGVGAAREYPAYKERADPRF